MTYRFAFPPGHIVKEEEIHGEKCLVVYSEKVSIHEPVGLVPFPDMHVLLKVLDGVKRPYIQITTHKTADLAIDSKDAKIEAPVKDGFWKIHLQG